MSDSEIDSPVSSEFSIHNYKLLSPEKQARSVTICPVTQHANNSFTVCSNEILHYLQKQYSGEDITCSNYFNALNTEMTFVLQPIRKIKAKEMQIISTIAGVHGFEVTAEMERGSILQGKLKHKSRSFTCMYCLFLLGVCIGIGMIVTHLFLTGNDTDDSSLASSYELSLNWVTSLWNNTTFIVT